MASKWFGGRPAYTQFPASYQGAATPWSTRSKSQEFFGDDIPLKQNGEHTGKTPLIYDTDNGNNSPRRASLPSSSKKPTLWYNWGLSFLSLFISLLAITAIVSLLAKADGQTLPHLPLHITVNTYISFLVTLAKAALLVPVADSIGQLKWLWFQQPRKLEDIQIFDDASRGPLGALHLMVRTRGIRLVSLGAVITVLALAMDPFTQQIVAYPSRNVEAGVASVGRAQEFDANIWIDTLDGGLLTGPDFAMKAAVYRGLFTPQLVTDLAPDCPSGNCTFPLFDSLAFCSKCLDVSQSVINNDPGLGSKIAKDPESVQGDYNISYTLPGNAVVDFTVFFSGGSLAMGPSMVSTTALPANLSKEMLGLQDPLLTFAVLQFPDVGNDISQANYFTSLPVTHECALYFCVNTYYVTVTNTVPNTTILSSWTSDSGTPTIGGAGASGIDMSDTQDAILEKPDDGIPGNNTYWIPPGTLATLKAWLNMTVQGSLNTTGSEVYGGNGPVWANDVMIAFNETSDWSSFMAALATSMTTYIRSYDLQEESGTAFRLETYVHVKWAWLAMPVALILFATILLVATIVVNEKRKGAVWKSKSLALLFHGLERVGGVEGKGIGDGPEEMDEVAKRTRVKLARNGKGEWKLVNTSDGTI